MSETNVAKPLVSVIVPCYNCAQYLSEALDSVYMQTLSDWECIIIDDGSTDNTKQIVLSYTQKDSRFKYIYQTNKGVSSARNAGIRNSVSKYILPLDADDKIATEYLKEATNILAKEPGIKLVYAKGEYFGKVKREMNEQPFSIRKLLIENIIFCSAVFKREDFNKTTGYSEDMVEGLEDWEFWVSFLNESDRVFQISHVRFYYRIRDNSRNPLNGSEVQRKLRRQIYEKHKELYDKYFYLPDVIYDYYLSDNNLKSIKQSYSHLIGNLITSPFRIFKQLFR